MVRERTATCTATLGVLERVLCGVLPWKRCDWVKKSQQSLLFLMLQYGQRENRNLYCHTGHPRKCPLRTSFRFFHLFAPPSKRGQNISDPLCDCFDGASSSLCLLPVKRIIGLNHWPGVAFQPHPLEPRSKRRRTLNGTFRLRRVVGLNFFISISFYLLVVNL